jgi:hypothetical protein
MTHHKIYLCYCTTLTKPKIIKKKIPNTFKCSFCSNKSMPYVDSTSIRLLPSITDETVCQIFMKFGAGVLYKKLSRNRVW